jgi:hypothetical protein
MVWYLGEAQVRLEAYPHFKHRAMLNTELGF